jgi:phosphatidylglycerophosphate synthase
VSSGAILLALTERTESDLPTCLLDVDGEPQIVNLLNQLRHLGVRPTMVLCHQEWSEAVAESIGPRCPEVEIRAVAGRSAVPAAIAEALNSIPAPSDGVLVIHADVVTHAGALAKLLLDPRIRSGVLASGTVEAPAAYQLKLDHGRVIDCASPYHEIDSEGPLLLGAMKLDHADVEAAADASGRLGRLLEDPPDSWTTRSPGAADELALLTVGVVRGGAELRVSGPGGFAWARPRDRETAAAAGAALDVVDEDRVLLDAAVKTKDGFFTTFFVSPYSKFIARAAARAGFSPNQVTVFSMLLGIAAGIAFAFGTLPGRIVGAILLQLAFTFDCVDGQLARYTQNYSAFGAWLDSMLDRGKEYVVYAGLAYGAVRTGSDESIWMLAAATLALQGVRHLLDFSYSASRSQAARAFLQPSLATIEGVSITTAPATAQAAPIRLANSLENSWMRWPKRMITMPIGERFALISVTALFWGAQVTFPALLVWGTVATLYSTTGRIMRSTR